MEWYWMQWSATLFFTNLALSRSIQIFKCSFQTWITSLQLYCRIKCRQLPVITCLCYMYSQKINRLYDLLRGDLPCRFTFNQAWVIM